LIWRLRRQSFFVQLPFYIILSGAVPNLLNRILRGSVVDFIHIHWKDVLDWPYLFNVADALIVAGVLLLFVLNILGNDTFKHAFEQKREKA
jgi:signal peptidase II